MPDELPTYSVSDYRRDLRHRQMIDAIHAEFGICFRPDEEAESGWRLALKSDTDHDWRIDAFLQLLSDRMQPAIAEYIRKQNEREAAKAASRLVDGPFDGEEIEVHKNGGTIAKKIRNRWWAVYKRKIGEYPARFVGYATSKSRALSYSLVHATPASERPAQPNMPPESDDA